MAKRILVVEDDKVLNRLLATQLGEMGYDTHGVIDEAELHAFLSHQQPDLILLDVRLPNSNGLELLPELAAEVPVIVLTAFDSVQDAVSAMKAGAWEYLVKPVDLDELELQVKRVFEFVELRSDHTFYKNRFHTEAGGLMIGAGSAMEEVRTVIGAVAQSPITVLIQGESGVGKELVAKAVHDASPRSQRTFVTVDCCALQENLFESELFGHERGAFTGAQSQKKGLIEAAEGGTLFLDEIGEISPTIQAKLLRVIETGEFRRLGGIKTLRSNVRIVAATNRDLEALSNDDTFRSDLYYRLSAFRIAIPPLRERREDIPDLVQHFLSNLDMSGRTRNGANKGVSVAAMKELVAYDWPGNVRELRNVIERAVILAGNVPYVGTKHLGLNPGGAEPAGGLTLNFPHEPSLEEIERKYLESLLLKYSGHRSTIASVLGIAERSVYRILEKHGLRDL